jgi:flagellar hook-associated protein 1 FlgK
VHVNGLAGVLTVSAAVDPAQGGNALLLRDGGIGGAAYVYNTAGQPGYANRLIALGDSLTATQTFSADAQVSTQSSLLAFADTTAGWLQEQRKVSASELEFRNTIYSRASESLSQSAGVSLDQELAHMLELERSYQANSRLISVMDDMIRGLLEDVR